MAWYGHVADVWQGRVCDGMTLMIDFLLFERSMDKWEVVVIVVVGLYYDTCN